MNDPQPKLIVSIHDVRPGLKRQVVEMLSTLKQEGVARTSLLVIPHFHSAEPLLEDRELVSKIHQWQTAGHEVMLHALTHREESIPRHQGVMGYLISQHYTDGEGEFYRLGFSEAKQRLQAGKAIFSQLQLPTHSFTAPAWLYSQEAIAALCSENFSYYTTLTTIQPIHQGKRTEPIRARAIVWSHRKPWRRFTSNLFLPGMAQRIIRRRGALRLALHPPDFTYPEIRSCALQILRRALAAGYRPTTYAEVVRDSNLS